MTEQTNARFVFFNDFDSAENLTANSPTIAGLEVTNLQFYGNSERFRTTQTNETVITGNWTEKKVISCFIPYKHNLGVNDTIRLQLYSDINMTTLLVDIELPALPKKNYNDLEYGIDAYGDSIFKNWSSAYTTFWFVQVIAKAFKVTIKSPSNTNGFVDIARIYMGRYLSPKINFSWGYSLKHQSKSEKQRTAGGGLYGRKTASFRKLQFDLDWLPDIDTNLFLDAVRQVGTHQDIFVSLYPENGGEKERNNSMAGKLADTPEFSHQFNNNYQAPFVIEEA